MYGLDLTTRDYEEIAVTRIAKKYRKSEAELMNSCWWDYRGQHPTYRTYLFAGCYREAFRRLYVKYIDSEITDNVKGYSRPDPLDNRPNRGKTSKIATPTYLWRARQYADEMGMPYDFYVSTAAELAVRWKTGEAAVGRMKTSDSRKLMLSASNLYQENIILGVYERWQDMMKHAPLFARSKAYVMDGKSEPTPLQLAHERHVISQAMKMSYPQYCLSNAVIKGHVRLEILKAASFIDDWVLSEIIELSQC